MTPRILLASLLALALPASADMYKWVDEKGVTHFSETPPPDGSKASKITVSPTPPSAPVAPPVDYKTKELDARKAHVEKDAKAQQEAAEEAQKAALKKGRCMEAQRMLQVLGMQRPIFTTNEKGEKVYVEDEARQAQTEKWQARAKEFCE